MRKPCEFVFPPFLLTFFELLWNAWTNKKIKPLKTVGLRNMQYELWNLVVLSLSLSLTCAHTHIFNYLYDAGKNSWENISYFGVVY